MSTPGLPRLNEGMHVVMTRFGMIVGRSLFPFSALLIISGTVLWGPWASLVLGYVWWRVVARIG